MVDVVAVIDWVVSYGAFLTLMGSLLCLVVFAALRRPLKTLVSLAGVAVSIWWLMY